MRVLFFAKHPGNARMFESTIRGLADRGHAVHLAFDQVKTPESLALVRRLASENVTYGLGPGSSRELPELRVAMRASLDYLRYLEPVYAEAESLRARAAAAAPAALQAVVPPGSPRPVVRAAAATLRLLERRLPDASSFTEFVSRFAPDVVLVTPLVGVASRQADALRAATRLGIPTVYPVHSWDNLTNKGLVRDVPGLTLVWNEAQALEAVELQGIPAEKVRVTGAPGFDHWFERRPSRSRAELLAAAGLDGDRPFLLYTCSSPFIAPDETGFVRSWLRRLRQAGEPLADAAVVVRPHPQNAEQWAGVDLDDDLASVWPRAGEDPLDESSRQNYFDSLALSSAVVGVNTSALVEAAIVARPVHVLLEASFAGKQTGTLHFRHLADGHVHVEPSWDDHLAGLARAVRSDAPDPRAAAFARSFLRPSGMPATPLVVSAIEEAAGAQPARAVRGSRIVARALVPAERRLARARRATIPPQPRTHPAVRDARRVLRRLAQEAGPIVAGPYRSEVGHELLYWIPFLNWAVTVEPALAGRIVAVSRGGVASWYAGLDARYLELYDLFSPDELWRRTVESSVRGKRKQTVYDELDREIVEELERRHGFTAGGVLHPSVLFDLMRSVSKSDVPLDQEPFLRRKLSAPDLDLGLPDRYVAVRFYASAAFPATEANETFVRATVDGLLAQGEVVVLGAAGEHDDHVDILREIDGVRFVEGDARDNLAVQTAAVSGATSFVGTYGGLSYLPPLVGVDALAFYSERNFRPEHLAIAEALASEGEGFGSFRASTPA